jgi:hypothetical protein
MIYRRRATAILLVGQDARPLIRHHVLIDPTLHLAIASLRLKSGGSDRAA